MLEFGLSHQRLDAVLPELDEKKEPLLEVSLTDAFSLDKTGASLVGN